MKKLICLALILLGMATISCGESFKTWVGGRPSASLPLSSTDRFFVLQNYSTSKYITKANMDTEYVPYSGATTDVDIGYNGFRAIWISVNQVFSTSEQTDQISAQRLILTNAVGDTCDVSHAGQVEFIWGGSGVADTLRVCAKDAAGTYAWRTLY